jgi:transcription-repair coupling factor (superfamily II helicase)
MKPEEKEEVMRRFVKGEIQILVSTTVNRSRCGRSECVGDGR